MNEIKQVCIYGLGGVGGFFGGQMGLAAEQGRTPGCSVSFIMRGAHLAAVQEKGLTIIVEGSETVTVRPAFAASTLAEIPKPDLILLGLKSYHLPEALQAIKPFVDADTIIMPLLNGFNIYDRLRAVLPDPIILPSCCYIVAKIEAPGVIWNNGGLTRIISGLDSARRDYDGKSIQTYLRQVGLDLEWHDDPWPKIWEKYLFIAGMNLVDTDYKILGQADMPEDTLRERYHQVVGEMVQIARKMDVQLENDIVDRISNRCIRQPLQQTTSFQRDLLGAGKNTEVELFGPALLRRGEELGVDTPGIAEIVRKMEAHFPGVKA
jgi:2-dehydropantoate 2-reductase